MKEFADGLTIEEWIDYWRDNPVANDQRKQDGLVLDGPHTRGVLEDLRAAGEEIKRLQTALEESRKSYCVHCKRLFPKGREGVEQFKSHIAECNAHPLQPMARLIRDIREVLMQAPELNPANWTEEDAFELNDAACKVCCMIDSFNEGKTGEVP